MYRFFDQPVDPQTYLLRPGEELIVTFVKAKLSPMTLTIDPQGRIVHQTLGLFDLSGQTLAMAQAVLKKALAKLYLVDEIDISVSKPQRTAIQVSGAVVNPGLYKGFTSHRASEIIEKAGGIAWGGSYRQIKFSGGPSELIVDLDKTRYLGDNSANPYLYSGYSIHVPSKSAERVQVVGEVNHPREIELVAGDDLQTLIALAGGVRSRADLNNIRIANRPEVTDLSTYQPQPGDIIMVPSRAVTGDDMKILVFGAVEKPGKYAFSQGAAVGDLIELAGSFTVDAGRELTTLFRKATSDEWGRKSERRYPITSAVGADGSILNMKLLPEDSVYVPFRVGYVKVSGEVLNPGRYPVIDGKDAFFYIRTAGGFLPRANTEEISIYNRVARTTADFSPGVLVHDGDEVIVKLREELR